MNTKFKKFGCVALAAVVSVPLAACSTEPAESMFDSVKPWHKASLSYEKLDYDVAIYDTRNGITEDKQIKIASGDMSFTLDENGAKNYTSVDMSFSVTYNTLAEDDAELTDTITSNVLFEPNSLAAARMSKTVTLADRKGKTNLSYKIDADYFDTHTATLSYTRQPNPEKQTLSLSADACRDNEMMFFIARAQNISNGSSTMFRVVNIFDSFLNNSITRYEMTVSGSDEKSLDIGDFVKDLGVQAVKDETTQQISYPVPCVSVNIAINATNHGPAYTVLYSSVPFKQGEEEHKKIPICIEYSQFNGSNPYRRIVYTLKACDFEK